jgi:hypothetical protein
MSFDGATHRRPSRQPDPDRSSDEFSEAQEFDRALLRERTTSVLFS